MIELKNNIGPHIDMKSLTNNVWPQYKTFQIFLNNPQKYSTSVREKIPQLKDYKERGLNIVVHTAFWSCLADEQHKTYGTTLSTLENTAKVLQETGHKHICTHVGWRKDYDEKKAKDDMVKFCEKWLLRTKDCPDVILGLENDSGSQTGTKMGFVDTILQVIEEINDPRIRMVYDTEHGYAAGIDFPDVPVEKIRKYAHVIHFNSIPKNIKLGMHQDRHSTVTIHESKEPYEKFLKLFADLYEPDKLFILERNMDLALIDFNKLLENKEKIWNLYESRQANK